MSTRVRSNPVIHTMRSALFVAFLMNPLWLDAQQPAVVTELQQQRIGELFSDISTETPGCAVAIYRRGRVVYSRGFGSADLEHGVPITPSSRFDIGSTSKQFTAAAVLLLEQDGVLSLDDDVRKWIPELHDFGETITIRHLLHHTSGLRDYIGLLVLGGADIDDVTTDDDALRVIARQRELDFPSGSAHAYSNTGYFLASVIVRRAGGKSLRDFASERIFGPLGMTATTYIDDHTEVLPERAIGYSPTEDAGSYARDVSNWEQNGDGGIFTTVEDLALWDRNFYSGTVGGEVLIRGLLERDTLIDGEPIDYARGLFHAEIAGRPAVMHGGAWGGYRAELVRIPSEELSVAILSNNATIDPSGRAEEVMMILLGEERSEPALQNESTSGTEPVEVAIDPSLFDRYVGEYRLDIAPDVIMTIYRDGDRYMSRVTGQSAVEIYPSSDSTFFLRVVEAGLTFHRGTGGEVTQLTIHQGGNDMIARRLARPTITTEELDRYTGSWYSPELDRYYRITREGESLHGTFGDNPAATLDSDGDNIFSADAPFPHRLTFATDDSGTLTEMRLTYGRAKGILFERVGGD